MKRKVKGVLYEDFKEERCEEEHPELAPDSSGQAKWRMEVNTTIGLGIPQSQIMDTGGEGEPLTFSLTTIFFVLLLLF